MGFKLKSKTNCGGVGEPPCPDPSEASKTRKGETVYVDGKPGKYTFHKFKNTDRMINFARKGNWKNKE
jgi:hypothetical protein